MAEAKSWEVEVREKVIPILPYIATGMILAGLVGAGIEQSGVTE